MSEKEQVKPLAPAAAFQLQRDEDRDLSMKLHQRKCIKCCGCVTAVILIIAVIILILFFTAFHIKEPEIKMNKVIVQQLEFDANGMPRTDVNMTLLADVSVKNPNVASFKFNNGTTTIYYGGTMVGEAKTPPGKAKARRTVHMNVTVNIIPQKMLAVPNLLSDISSGALKMSSYSVTDGKVKIFIIKKHMVVEINCTMAVNISSLTVDSESCKSHCTV